jgi:hypothetical protein
MKKYSPNDLMSAQDEQDANTSKNIIQKQATPYTNTFPEPFYKGDINPLKKRILTQNLNIDTRFREAYNSTESSNFHTTLPHKFTNIISMELSSFEFSHTFYMVSEKMGNNFFQITKEVNGAPESMMVIIPDGNYIGSDLITYFNDYAGAYSNSQGQSNFTDIHFYLDANTITGTNTGSGRIVISSFEIIYMPPLTYPLIPGAGSFNFTLNFQTDIYGNADLHTPLQKKLGWIIGYRSGLYELQTNYVSEGIFDMSGIKYMYLSVNDYNNSVNNSFYGVFQKSVLNNNILARIPILEPFYAVDSQSNRSAIVTHPREFFGPVAIQKLHIQLLDEYGVPIWMNNMDYSFCLTFKMIYDL